MLPRVLLVLLMMIVAQASSARSPGILLTLSETTLGEWTFEWSGSAAIAVTPSNPINFSWIADPEFLTHGATITGYRFGWDVLDLEDPDDPGWASDWRDDVVSAPTRSFEHGGHSFTVVVKDDLGRVTTATIIITIDAGVPSKPMSWGQLKRGW